MVPDATVAAGEVYSAFAVVTTYADSLNVLLVQDDAGAAGVAATPLPDTGGSTWIPLTATLALMASRVLTLVLVRRTVS